MLCLKECYLCEKKAVPIALCLVITDPKKTVNICLNCIEEIREAASIFDVVPKPHTVIPNTTEIYNNDRSY